MKEDIKKIFYLKQKIACLPECPGVYIMKDEKFNIIYIGKAKNLKNRVSQYFTSSQTKKVASMVENINDFEYIITDSEYEALVLECNLIKRNLPKYNILLKDDKGYSYIKISKEKWPRISIVKKISRDKSKYIGPFLNFQKLNSGLNEVIKIFKLPTCNRNLEKKSKPCLNYYIDQCSAPCNGKISLRDYLEDVKGAVSFFKNGSQSEINKLKKDMSIASDKLEFEKAAKIRDRIKLIDSLNNKQKVILNEDINCDFISFVHDNKFISMHILKFDNGNLYDSENFIMEFDGNNICEVKSEVIQGYYIMRDRVIDKIFIDDEINNLDNIQKWISEKLGKKVTIQNPVSKEKLSIMKMCKNNALDSLIRNNSQNNNNLNILVDLKTTLSLKNLPKYIEAYDISNIQGKHNVGGMVVFENGEPEKSLYKKFMIKTVSGQDDYSSMLEVIKRRFNRYLAGDSENGFSKRPDLILIDGGIEHTKIIRRYMQNIGLNEIPVFGMVKDGKHRTKAITNDEKEIKINHKTNLFSFITKIQDEVHRFTITYHRKKRSSDLNSSTLLEIRGIGKKRSEMLLKRFKSIERISQTSIKELLTIPGITQNVAKCIVEYFKKQNETLL